ncbi:hypothetical protein TRICI_004229 [Trichomonascus ciferrii]|uniref:Uncharacterized protein n=1 Tax=Trichomonascus ciferrii TaxID=44093 RepID=A0A642V174_9ASCO|nr:hypothetical protein TRICI_004229 [Trichomonascus ciferrii]
MYLSKTAVKEYVSVTENAENRSLSLMSDEAYEVRTDNFHKGIGIFFTILAIILFFATIVSIISKSIKPKSKVPVSAKSVEQNLPLSDNGSRTATALPPSARPPIRPVPPAKIQPPSTPTTIVPLTPPLPIESAPHTTFASTVTATVLPASAHSRPTPGRRTPTDPPPPYTAL